jgi:uncharacterized protein (TIGR02300 family)
MRGSDEVQSVEGRVTKAEWGTKRTCATCGGRFYDLNKTPILCPKCGAENEKDSPPKPRRGKPARAEPVKVAKKPALPNDDDPLIDDDDDDDNPAADLMEDASDLGEDDDDMAEVIEHIESGEDED